MSELDATIEQELQVVDEALERGRVTATTEWERELQEVALAVADEAPEPDPAFAADLDERVRAGFPRDPRLSLPSLPKLRRPPAIALAGAASLLVALAVAVPLLSGDSEGEPRQFSGGEMELPGAGESERVPDGALEDFSGAAPGELAAPTARGRALRSAGAEFAPGTDERRIERSASLTIEAPGGRMDAIADDIVTIADRYEGFVLRSEVASGEDGFPGGEFELRIPAERLQPALRALSKLGDVRSRTQAGDDVTRAFVSAGDLLEGARAERESLLGRLAEAETDEETESLRRQLNLNASEINRLEGRLRDLRLRTNYAAVDVTLEQADPDDGGEGAGGSTDGLGGALDDALDSLSASVELLVRALGVAIPVGLLVTVGWLGARSARRRRREAALQG